jgi:type VI secretion system protein ImpG
MLGDPSSDPDVERLLEGVAFLTGSIREKLDDEFPEIVHDLLRQIWPQYLRPLPSCTLITVTAGEKLSQSTALPAGIYLDSVPVNGTACRFKTCQAVDVHPVTFMAVDYREPLGKNPMLRLTFSMKATGVSEFNADRLRLHLGGNYGEASDLYLRLLTGLKEIRVHAHEDPDVCRLEPENLIPCGFSSSEAMIPWPSNVFDGYRLLQEYFIMPEKFLFIEIKGLERWTSRKQSRVFHIDLVLRQPWPDGIKPGLGSFSMSTVPAVNLFPHPARPEIADHRRTDYAVIADGDRPAHYQVFSIESVSMSQLGKSRDIQFRPFHSFSGEESEHVYHERLTKNPVRNAVDFSVSLVCPPGNGLPNTEILSFEILCTNGFLAEHLGEGDICRTAKEGPEAIEFRNIRKPTVACLPALGSEMLWRLTSLLTLNHLPLTHTENLQALLSLFLMEGHRDRQGARINERRIGGIRSIKTVPADRLVSGVMVRGAEIRMSVSQSHFAGIGDVYLFGTLFDRFLAMYASLNTFTRLVITETDSGEIFTWKERLGTQPLI